MLVTINPCFHWIGYHICTGLLQEGKEVVGIDPILGERSDLLYMYVGRNSNFQHFFQKEDKEQYVHGTENEVMVEYVESCLLVKRSGSEKVWVELPNLYGEWMEVEQFGIEEKEELYHWVKEKEAVYIGDFLDRFLPYIVEEKPFQLLDHEQDEETLKERIESIWRCQALLQKM